MSGHSDSEMASAPDRAAWTEVAHCYLEVAMAGMSTPFKDMHIASDVEPGIEDMTRLACGGGALRSIWASSQ